MMLEKLKDMKGKTRVKSLVFSFIHEKKYVLHNEIFTHKVYLRIFPLISLVKKDSKSTILSVENSYCCTIF